MGGHLNTRKEQKERTRETIIKHTRDLLISNGLVRVSTKDISREANVSQGSIFLHFNTKDQLLLTIISEGLNEIENDLSSELDVKLSREAFLKALLDIIGRHESILSRVYKDHSYFSDNMRRSIDLIDNTIKNMIFDNLRQSSDQRKNIIDTFICVDAFLAQLKQYLSEKDVYTEFNSIIKQRRGKLVKLYNMLFSSM